MDNSRELQAPVAGESGKQKPPSLQSNGTLFGEPARGLVRLLYSSNPFYILSADLIFVGLRISFGSNRPLSSTWALWFGLAGYTLLLASTACFLIRKGKLWDDLRSLLLLIVMMFVAMATSGDDVMAADPKKGALRYLAGFLFAVVVTESVLRGIRLRLPGWYRAAYYAILGLVFLYPIALAPALSSPESSLLQWSLFGFSPLAALALLLLLPAARGGPGYVTANGSPWRWPLYPWSLFFVLAGGVGIRCYSLCVSFHFVNGSQTIFGPYFLVPIGLALSLVWLEIGIAARRRGVMLAASVMPIFLALLAMTGHRYESVYMNFLDMFRQSLGATPAYFTLVAAAIFLVYAAARRTPLACDLLAAALVALSTVAPQTLDLTQLVAPRPLPLAAAGIVLGSIALRKRQSIRGALAASLLMIAGTRGWLTVCRAADWTAVAIHVMIVGMAAVGAYFDDDLGELMQVGISRLAGAGHRLRSPRPAAHQFPSDKYRSVAPPFCRRRNGGLRRGRA